MGHARGTEFVFGGRFSRRALAVLGGPPRAPAARPPRHRPVKAKTVARATFGRRLTPTVSVTVVVSTPVSVNSATVAPPKGSSNTGRRGRATPARGSTTTVAPQDVELLPRGAKKSDAAGEDDIEPNEADLADVLAEVSVSDKDLETIQAELTRKTASAAPAGTTALARRDPMAAYMAEVRRHPLLTRQEEYDLAVRWVEDGDAEAGRKLVTSNLRLVVNIARGYNGRGLPLPDLIEEGNLGLMRAVEGFDPDMGTRFSTYASYWIKQSIKRALVNTAKTIRVPAYMVELLSKWRRASNELTEELNRTPTPEEIAVVLEIPPKKLRIVKKAIALYNATPQSDEDESGLSLGDIIPDERTRGPEDELINNDNLKHVFRLLDKMDSREATILRMRFGLDDSEPRTLKEIGESLGLTRERVRQIEGEALKKLNRSLSGE